jgi:ABC-type uncharacterized transport system auxiliary subunit
MRTWNIWNVDFEMRNAERKKVDVWRLSLLIVCALLTGCLGARGFTPVRYYSLEPLSDNTPRATRSWATPLGIQPFAAATRYRERMLYRLSEVEVNFYEYDRWVEPPEEMVTRIVAAALRASGLFPQVRQAANLQLPAWLLSAVLLRFDEVRGAQQSRAECWLRLELRRARDERLLWSKTLRAAAPLSNKSAAALAAAMTVAVQQIAQQLISELQTADLPRAE